MAKEPKETTPPENSGLSSMRLLLVALLVLGSGLIYFIYSASSKKVMTIPMTVKSIKEESNNIVRTLLDADGKSIGPLECDLEGKCKNVATDDFAGVIAWKILYYTSLYKQLSLIAQPTTEQIEQRNQVLERSLALNREFKEKNTNPVVAPMMFVFSEAFDNTGQIEFLASFLYPLAAYAAPLATGENDPKYFLTQLPMDTVRIAQQIFQLRAYLTSLPSSTLESVDFGNPEINKWFKNFLNSKEKFIENIEGPLLKILQGIDSSSIRPQVNQGDGYDKPLLDQVASGFFEGEKVGLNTEGCWDFLGYVNAWKITGDKKYLDFVSYLEKEGNLKTADYKSFAVQSLQSVLPCLEGFKKLSATDESYKARFNKFFEQVADEHLDSGQRPINSGLGTFISHRVSVGLDDRVVAPNSNDFESSDIMWFYSLIADQDFDIKLHKVKN